MTSRWQKAMRRQKNFWRTEVKTLKEVRRYLDEAGADIEGMTDEELKEASEVFALPSGGYLIVEG